MAGHSKWAQIKRSKAVVDAKRGAVFTRLGREIMVAARGGADPAGNFQLRTAIEKAKAAGVPNNNIDRAILKGSGQLSGEGDQFETVRYEGYGPGGVAVLIEAFTDNRNRTAADVRLAFGKQGGNLGETGCVGYLFEQRAVVRLEAASSSNGRETKRPGSAAAGPAASSPASLEEESLLERLLSLEESGGPAVSGYEIEADAAEVFGDFADLEALQDGLRQLGLPVQSWEHRWIPQTSCRLDDPEQLRACLRMLDALEELDDVRSVTVNLEADADLLEAIAA
ncbi:YebC/PmpR family DNA-binding transcriptional regulator [Synechococcus sp. CS-1328]|uniref:YebC/PmpR family DNA-binding transcriptional regulator n=1 Tax=Synechococcus sp. CS-1328 TaxID=2847976 RepID=UPI00223B9960|nr:YebC/PmpR family DNA-binding transcriptional regulator [Synechococcus sp. CS-1328]MCT0225773.1 YebC/PmpR family DNA-binding transcriptional regulator [Synechococcus sp. CS-1328]